VCVCVSKLKLKCVHTMLLVLVYRTAVQPGQHPRALLSARALPGTSFKDTDVKH
jgi:hypothetical protein